MTRISELIRVIGFLAAIIKSLYLENDTTAINDKILETPGHTVTKLAIYRISSLAFLGTAFRGYRLAVDHYLDFKSKLAISLIERIENT